MFENVKFIITPDQITFNTQINGDKIVLVNLVLTAEQAAAVAYLINQPESLEIEIAKEGD